MFCPQCGAQTEPAIKFCKACGLKLSVHARLLEDPEVVKRYQQIEAKSADQLGSGAMLLIVVYFCLLLFCGLLGFAGLPIWLVTPLLVIFLLLGVKATITIWRSGLFEFLWALQIRKSLGRIERKHELRNSIVNDAQPAFSAELLATEPAIIEEEITRKLPGAEPITNKINGE